MIKPVMAAAQLLFKLSHCFLKVSKDLVHSHSQLLADKNPQTLKFGHLPQSTRRMKEWCQSVILSLVFFSSALIDALKLGLGMLKKAARVHERAVDRGAQHIVVIANHI